MPTERTDAGNSIAVQDVQSDLVGLAFEPLEYGRRDSTLVDVIERSGDERRVRGPARWIHVGLSEIQSRTA